MKIENQFTLAQVQLVKSEHFFRAGEYSASLIALTKVYPQIRSLIEKVYKLDRPAAAAEHLDGDNHP